MPIGTRENPSQSPAFEGLSEREIVELFQIGERRFLQSGQQLPLSQSPENPLILGVLEGRLKLLVKHDDSDREVAELTAGDWGGGADPESRADNALALERSSVLTVALKALNTADPRLRGFLERRLANGSAAESAEGPTSASGSIDRLSRYVRSRRESRCNHYEDSGLVREILEEVPYLPMYASDLAVRLRESHVSPRDAAERAKQDPSLAAAILRAVNSGRYGLRTQVADFQQAVTLLGLNQTHQIALDHSVRETLPDEPDFHALRTHALLISQICFELSRMLDPQPTPGISTLGMLHDVGRVVVQLMKRRQERYAGLADELDAAHLGALLLRRWRLPESLWRAVHFQDYPHFSPPQDIPSDCRREIGMLHLAHLCLAQLESGAVDPQDSAFLEAYWEELEVPCQDVPELAEERLLPQMTAGEHSFPEPVNQVLREATRRIRESWLAT